MIKEKGNASTPLVNVNLYGAGSLTVPSGTAPLELFQYDRVQRVSPVVAAMINNVLFGIDWRIRQDSNIELVDLEFDDCMRVYA